MRRLEEVLRDALRRKDPPGGLADRVMLRLAPGPPAKSRWKSQPVVRWVAAVTVVVAILAGHSYHQHRQTRMQGEAAKEQLMGNASVALSVFIMEKGQQVVTYYGAWSHVRRARARKASSSAGHPSPLLDSQDAGASLWSEFLPPDHDRHGV